MSHQLIHRGTRFYHQHNLARTLDRLDKFLYRMGSYKILSFSTTVMKNIPLEAIEGVEEQEIDSNVLAGLPSAVIYIAAPGDDLWSIGRKYHMPVKTVRELNALESDELRPGQKVLLVKGLA